MTGFTGRILFDTSIPDGTPRKLMDSALFRGLGWSQRIALDEVLTGTCRDFLA